jgi:hypothetical protein
MRIFSDGNVFIGSSPSNAGFKLDVNGTGRFSAGVQSIGTEEAFRFQRTTGTASDIYSLNADSGSAYLYNNTTSNVLMAWAEGGNVGIGVSSLVSPGGSRRLLQISNSTNGALIALGSSTTESNNPRIFSGQYDLGFAAGVTTGVIDFYTNDTIRLTLASTGAATFTGDATVSSSNSTGIFTIGNRSGNNAGIFKFASSTTATNWIISNNAFTANALQFTPSTAGGGDTYTTPALSLDSTGNVGIGTASPNDLMEIKS